MSSVSNYYVDGAYYVAGPMTGYAAYNYPAFEQAAAALRRQGLEVRSAHEVVHTEPITAETGIVGSPAYRRYIAEDLAVLLQCQAIVLLRGWPESTGAKFELTVALMLGLAVYFWDGKGLINMSGLMFKGCPLEMEDWSPPAVSRAAGPNIEQIGPGAFRVETPRGTE